MSHKSGRLACCTSRGVALFMAISSHITLLMSNLYCKKSHSYEILNMSVFTSLQEIKGVGTALFVA